MSFIVRIELHSSNLNDFNMLHQVMSNKGFLQTITGTDGTDYYLPRATYLAKTSKHTRSEILKLAKECINSIGKTAEVLVVEYTGCNWDGLKPIR